jgi:FkbM family methyltransferase
MTLGRLRAARRLLGSSAAWSGVGARWVLYPPNMIDKRFKARADIRVEHEDDYQIVCINGRQYVWPEGMSLDPLLQIVSELTTSSHPNQYLWGPTKVQKGDVVFDIGSCEGSFSAVVAELGARPIAVEPSPRMQQVIRRLFRVRGLDEPTVVGCLLGREPGRLAFIEDLANVGHSRIAANHPASADTIQVSTLDDVVESLGLDRCDFIKCDAEGADVDIIMGGTRTLSRFHPKLAICTYHADDHYVRLRQHLLQLGYRVRGKGFLNAGGNLRVVMLHAWWPN